MNASTPTFKYRTGETVVVGDYVSVAGPDGEHAARIVRVMGINTQDARAFGCEDTGGVLTEEDWQAIKPKKSGSTSSGKKT